MKPRRWNDTMLELSIQKLLQDNEPAISISLLHTWNHTMKGRTGVSANRKQKTESNSCECETEYAIHVGSSRGKDPHPNPGSPVHNCRKFSNIIKTSEQQVETEKRRQTLTKDIIHHDAPTVLGATSSRSSKTMRPTSSPPTSMSKYTK